MFYFFPKVQMVDIGIQASHSYVAFKYIYIYGVQN